MKKFLFLFAIAALSLFLISSISHAQEAEKPPIYVIEVSPPPVNTPTPIPTPTPVGGPPNGQCGAVGLRCCSASENINVTTGPVFDICVPWFWRVCISDMFSGIMNNVVNTDLKGLDVAQTCNTSGVPQFKEDPPGSSKYTCLCANISKADVQSTQMCSHYIAPEVMRRIGTPHSTKSIFNESNPLNPFVDYTIDYNLLKNDKEYNSCFNCFNQGGYYSGIGCIYTSNLKDLINKNIFGWGLGLAGIMAIGCIAFAAMQFQLSQGDPEKIKKSRELITSCIMGLMLIIFSVFILKVIGVDILALPGFAN